MLPLDAGLHPEGRREPWTGRFAGVMDQRRSDPPVCCADSPSRQSENTARPCGKHERQKPSRSLHHEAVSARKRRRRHDDGSGTASSTALGWARGRTRRDALVLSVRRPRQQRPPDVVLTVSLMMDRGDDFRASPTPDNVPATYWALERFQFAFAPTRRKVRPAPRGRLPVLRTDAATASSAPPTSPNSPIRRAAEDAAALRRSQSVPLDIDAAVRSLPMVSLPYKVVSRKSLRRPSIVQQQPSVSRTLNIPNILLPRPNNTMEAAEEPIPRRPPRAFVPNVRPPPSRPIVTAGDSSSAQPQTPPHRPVVPFFRQQCPEEDPRPPQGGDGVPPLPPRRVVLRPMACPTTRPVQNQNGVPKPEQQENVPPHSDSIPPHNDNSNHSNGVPCTVLASNGGSTTPSSEDTTAALAPSPALFAGTLEANASRPSSSGHLRPTIHIDGAISKHESSSVGALLRQFYAFLGKGMYRPRHVRHLYTATATRHEQFRVFRHGDGFDPDPMHILAGAKDDATTRDAANDHHGTETSLLQNVEQSILRFVTRVEVVTSRRIRLNPNELLCVVRGSLGVFRKREMIPYHQALVIVIDKSVGAAQIQRETLTVAQQGERLLRHSAVRISIISSSSGSSEEEDDTERG